jgi:hypothetical protein
MGKSAKSASVRRSSRAKKVRAAPSEMLRKFTVAYKVVQKLHEPLCPVGSSEHSLTGNITAASFGQLAHVLKEEVPEVYRLAADSIYLDIGR